MLKTSTTTAAASSTRCSRASDYRPCGCGGCCRRPGAAEYSQPRRPRYHHRAITTQADIPEGCAPCPPKSGHRGCAERGRTWNAATDNSAAETRWPAFPHAGGGAGQCGTRYAPQSGGPCSTTRISAQSWRRGWFEGAGGSILQAYHIARKINRKTFHFLCRYDAMARPTGMTVKSPTEFSVVLLIHIE